MVGEALCRDNAENIKEGEEGGKFGFWRFGIDEVELDNGSTTGVVTMWDPRVNAVFSDFVGATHLCIGEIRGNDDPTAYSEERPWLIVYNEKRNDYMATLICDGAEASLWDGTESKRTLMKMVNNQDIDTYTSYPVSVLKLKKGNTKDPNDDDALWKINSMPIRLPTLFITKIFADGRSTLSNRQLLRVTCRRCRRQCSPVYDHLPRPPKAQ